MVTTRAAPPQTPPPRCWRSVSLNGVEVAICGGGTKSEWGSSPAAPAVMLSTLSLNRVVAHRHGDLTATIEAGARLDDVNRELARHGQWLPLDPPWSDRATIGGIVATNDAGPRRHRYGTPRDLIIGIEIARADGVRAKAGGIVVKNVAGYDLARLMTGSFGIARTDHQCDLQAVPARRCISDRHHRSTVQRTRRIAHGGVERQSPDADRR